MTSVPDRAASSLLLFESAVVSKAAVSPDAVSTNKRPAKEANVEGGKKAKCVGLFLADDLDTAGLVCPITGRLFVAPVVCEDGSTYERMAYARYLKDRTGLNFDLFDDPVYLRMKNVEEETVKSPVTGSSIGVYAYPNHAVVNAVRFVVASGALPRSVVGEWQYYDRVHQLLSTKTGSESERAAKCYEAAEVLSKGDPDLGIPPDSEAARDALFRAVRLGSLDARYLLSMCYDSGSVVWGISKNPVLHGYHLALAAEKGHDGASQFLRSVMAQDVFDGETSSDDEHLYWHRTLRDRERERERFYSRSMPNREA